MKVFEIPNFVCGVCGADLAVWNNNPTTGQFTLVHDASTCPHSGSRAIIPAAFREVVPIGGEVRA